jgi:hypothetical protein
MRIVRPTINMYLVLRLTASCGICVTGRQDWNVSESARIPFGLELTVTGRGNRCWKVKVADNSIGVTVCLSSQHVGHPAHLLPSGFRMDFAGGRRELLT